MCVELYQNIRNRRIELNLSQSELASKVGYKDKGSISRIENGSLDLTQSQILKFADALECSPSYLMGWDDKAQAKSPKDRIINELEEIKKLVQVSQFSDFTPSEVKIIEQIRRLDERGKTVVLRTISEELQFSRLDTYTKTVKKLMSKGAEDGNT